MKSALNTASRREFIKKSGIISVGFLGLQTFVYQGCKSLPLPDNSWGYGDLIKDPEGILNLPKGFTYQIISRKGSIMTDGLFTPGKPDGMAAFVGKNGKVILIRNHEISPEQEEEGAFGENYALLGKIDREKMYDYGFGRQPALGGTTTLLYNEQTGKVEKDFLSLAGTSRNCAGGPTPWGSWITCEETVDKKGSNKEKDHGYAFEVPSQEEMTLAAPIPLKAMGRMNREAVAVHPSAGIVYQTEDRHDGLIYRYIPKVPQKLAKGGKVQVLSLKAQKSMDTRNWVTEALPVGKKMEVIWLDIEEVESPNDDLRYRGFAKGAARFARGEGIWFGKDSLYFACTNGGQNKKGQIFRYIPSPFEGTPREKDSPGILELFVEPNNTNLVQNCDNLTIAPWGDLIVCEDHSHPRIVGVTPQGNFYHLAKNTGFNSEFAGAVFSPSGKTLFVNIQHAGLTLAITGSWIKK